VNRDPVSNRKQGIQIEFIYFIGNIDFFNPIISFGTYGKIDCKTPCKTKSGDPPGPPDYI
jgi:hypothetical protein